MFALMELSRDELLWISNALNEVLHGSDAIEEWEFLSRMGSERHEVQSLLRKVNDRVGELR
jgi:hypothetical protein